MNLHERHEANRRSWNALSAAYIRNRTQKWREAVSDPTMGFSQGTLELLRELCPDLSGKDACVLGSGDQFAAFGLAGMGARVTSVDISEEQLAVGEARATELGLDVTFVRADVCDLRMLEDASFDLACCTNGMLIWVSDLPAFYREASRILKPGGAYFWFDIHPFQRPFYQIAGGLRVRKPYFDSAPREYWSDANDVNRSAEEVPEAERESLAQNFVSHHTVGELINPLADVGFQVVRVFETGADTNWWRHDERGGLTDEQLLDWRQNPIAGLPTWMAIGARKLFER